MAESKLKILYIELPGRDVGQKRPAPRELVELLQALSISLNADPSEMLR